MITELDIQPYAYGKFEFSVNGLRVTGEPTFEEWTQVGHKLSVDIRGIQLQVGDWLRIGDEYFGELAAQVIDARSWSESTVRVYRHVAMKVPIENRMLDRGLTYSHLQAVVALPLREQKKWLTQAAETDSAGKPWPVARLKAAIKAGGDQVVTSWVVIAFCESEAQRDTLLSELESRGIRCKASEKRGGTHDS